MFQIVVILMHVCWLVIFSVRFHIAHVLELQGKYRAAKEAYEKLIEPADTPAVVKANTLRQLGKLDTPAVACVVKANTLRQLG